ncbi:MAG TPA: hypothetical protein VMW68_00675 [Methyloceanibacter sp.]|nr:hypothetical protein [Methyloceanibacter sp.]
MKTLIALVVAFGVSASFATSVFAADCVDGEHWDEDMQTCVPSD